MTASFVLSLVCACLIQDVDASAAQRGMLTVADAEKFQRERPKNDILQDIQWRVGQVFAGKCAGKKVMVFDYYLVLDPKNVYQGESFHAIFVDDKFEKFIRWDMGTADKPTKTGDCSRLLRLEGSAPVTLDELRKSAAMQTAPKKRPDLGLTAAWLVLGPKGQKKATAADYKRNAELIKQFNAGRLSIGMTEQEVQQTLQAKPIESGQLDAGACRVYGSKESLPVSFEEHFTNVVVIYHDGKASSFFSFPAGSLGEHDAPNGVIESLRKQDKAIGAGK